MQNLVKVHAQGNICSSVHFALSDMSSLIVNILFCNVGRQNYLKNMCIYDERIKIACHELTYLDSEIVSCQRSMNAFLIVSVILSSHFAIKYVDINFLSHVCFLATTTS